ncbi:MAG: hypothetical protein VB070_13910 [Clostridiaceae bacterium]|nr:hypothetical protein [Clostridiaceae bacterium]
MDNQVFIDEMRGTQPREETMTKHLGFYKARDVEQYIEKMNSRMHTTENVYQDRYEEMRTNLLGVSRERDKLLEKVQQQDKRLAEQQDLAAQMKAQDLVPVPRKTVEQLQVLEEIKQANEQLTQEYSRLTQENNQLNLEQTQLIQALKEREAELEKAVEMKTAYAQMQTDLDHVQLQIEERDNELSQSMSKYEALAAQYQAAQEVVRKLIAEKEGLTEDAVILQQRWDARRASLIRRYQGLLNSQQTCLQQMKENLATTLQYVEHLAEPGLKGFTTEEA